MSIITISRGSYSHGREVAEKVSQRLGYANVSREILIKASETFNVPEIKLARAVHDAPGFFERFTFAKERYVAYIESALLERFRQDNVVYHGLAGHFFIRNVSHVLKVRIVADPEDRIRTVMETQDLSRSQAEEWIEKDNRERREWSRRLYGIDTADPTLYDIVLHIRKLTIEDAATIICNTVGLKQFQATPESRQAVEDLATAARMKAAAVKDYPNIRIVAEKGCLTVHVRAATEEEKDIVRRLTAVADGIPGVRALDIHVVPFSLVD